MAVLNANTPYIECMIRKEYTGLEKDCKGYIFGVKSMINYPLLFHFQTNFGAIIWNQPISAFCHLPEYDTLSTNEQRRLSYLQTWDCQSNCISTTVFKFLEHKRVDVFFRDGEYRSGTYLFTVDDYEGEPNEINVGYANDMDSKCFQFIVLDNGNFCVHPNNLLRWHNADFIKPYTDPPKMKIRSDRMSSEDVNLTYANSPYYLYGNDKEKT